MYVIFMRCLLYRQRAAWLAKVSALIALVAIFGCDRPAPIGPAPGTRPAARTPRTRSTANVRPPAVPVEVPQSDDAMVLSLAAGGNVLDCRAAAYHPQMQAALAAREASLDCAGDGKGLALQVRPMADGPRISIASVRKNDLGVTLSWTDAAQTMACRPLGAYEDLIARACSGEGVALEGATIRRLWP